MAGLALRRKAMSLNALLNLEHFLQDLPLLLDDFSPFALAHLANPISSSPVDVNDDFEILRRLLINF